MEAAQANPAVSHAAKMAAAFKAAFVTLWTTAMRPERPRAEVHLPDVEDFDMGFERHGQHVMFEVPAFRGTGPVYGFAHQQGLKVLDIKQRGPVFHVKAVDSP